MSGNFVYGVAMDSVSQPQAAGKRKARLRGWQEIAASLGVDERTVKRWEQSRGLPVHRVPGESRAPVYAFEAELAAWLRSGGEAMPGHQQDHAQPSAGPTSQPPRRPWLWAMVLVAIVMAGVAWTGWRKAADDRQAAQARTSEVRQLARAQIAALNDRLERQPGTVRLREALARDAATILARIAALPDAELPLQIEAAEAYRRLSAVQSSTNRPSLRDRPAARASIDAGLALLEGPLPPAAQVLRTRLLIEAASHAAASGAVAQAPPLLSQAAATIGRVRGQIPPMRYADLMRDMALATSEVAQWQGRFTEGAAHADTVLADPDATPLQRIRAHDLGAEARYYANERPAALAGYRAALQAAIAAQAGAPDDTSLAWWALRERWNIGSTLLAMGRAAEAVDVLKAARDGWARLAAADPDDEALAWWLRTTRTSLGEALAAAGDRPAAIRELGGSLAERRAALAAQPANRERQRALVVGLASLADVLAPSRRTEACTLYAEAAQQLRTMDRQNALSPLDRQSLRPPILAAQARYCPPASSAANT